MHSCSGMWQHSSGLEDGTRKKDNLLIWVLHIFSLQTNINVAVQKQIKALFRQAAKMQFFGCTWLKSVWSYTGKTTNMKSDFLQLLQTTYTVLNLITKFFLQSVRVWTFRLDFFYFTIISNTIQYTIVVRLMSQCIHEQSPNFYFLFSLSTTTATASCLLILLLRQWLLWEPINRISTTLPQQMDPITLLAKQYCGQSFVKNNFEKQIWIGCSGNKAKRANRETKREREMDGWNNSMKYCLLIHPQRLWDAALHSQSCNTAMISRLIYISHVGGSVWRLNTLPRW